MAISVAAAALIGSALSAGSGLIGNLINRKTAKENLAFQREANNQNIAFQKEENDITRQREDNAVTRAAIDMQNAGLSKTLAAGNPASAQSLNAPSMNALNNQFKYESVLQKMNIASLMQDMAVKDANVKFEAQRVENETSETNARIENWAKQNDLYSSQATLNQSLTRLHDIEGDFKAKEIETSISYELQKIAESKSNVSLNNEQILKLSYEITESIARTQKLSYDVQLLVYDIVSKRLKNLTDSWNLSRNMVFGTPTNYTSSLPGKISRDLWYGTSGSRNNDFYFKGLDDIMVGHY